MIVFGVCACGLLNYDFVIVHFFRNYTKMLYISGDSFALSSAWATLIFACDLMPGLLHYWAWGLTTTLANSKAAMKQSAFPQSKLINNFNLVIF